jgi:CheY-like chemotaxis protein
MEGAAEVTSASGGVAQQPLTVLVVDDDADVAQGLAEFLEEEGFAVVTAGAGCVRAQSCST